MDPAEQREQIRSRQKDHLRTRQQAYRTTFDGPVAARVLEDLAGFCRAKQSTFHADARIHAVMEGRREVWLRIQEHLGLSEDDLWNMKNGG